MGTGRSPAGVWSKDPKSWRNMGYLKAWRLDNNFRTICITIGVGSLHSWLLPRVEKWCTLPKPVPPPWSNVAYGHVAAVTQIVYHILWVASMRTAIWWSPLPTSSLPPNDVPIGSAVLPDSLGPFTQTSPTSYALQCFPVDRTAPQASPFSFGDLHPIQYTVPLRSRPRTRIPGGPRRHRMGFPMGMGITRERE